MSTDEKTTLPIKASFYDVLEHVNAQLPAIESILPKGITKGSDALEFKVGRHGFVRLLDCMPRLISEGSIGIESRIVEAARVSYAGGTKSRSTDLGLLRYLFAHQHMSPFEMVKFTFMVRCELFTARQWMRHRTCNINEESARYSEMADDYYDINEEDVRAQSKTNKQGSDKSALTEDAKESFIEGYDNVLEKAETVYRKALADGVAREQARVVLPVGLYTKFYYTVDARNLLHFLQLRMDAHAQLEIRQYATAIYFILKKVAPHLTDLFDNYMRNAVTLSAHEIEALRTSVNKSPDMTASEAREWEAKRAAIFNALPASSSVSSTTIASSIASISSLDSSSVVIAPTIQVYACLQDLTPPVDAKL
jgi:thymidylate synthase (FAD)